eukprot:COSAG06_NODE_4_length_41837_cov_204.557597_11_plen_177_part_00
MSARTKLIMRCCCCSLSLLGAGRGAREDRCLRLRKLLRGQKLGLEKFFQLAKFVDETVAVAILVAAVGIHWRFWQHFAPFVWLLGRDMTILNGHLLKFGKVGVWIDASSRRSEQFVCVCWRLVDVGNVGVSLNGAWIIEVPAREKKRNGRRDRNPLSSASCWQCGAGSCCDSAAKC